MQIIEIFIYVKYRDIYSNGYIQNNNRFGYAIYIIEL